MRINAFAVVVEVAGNIFASQEVGLEELKVPDLGHFEYGAIAELPSLEQSEITNEEWRSAELSEAAPEAENDLDDLWDGIVPGFALETKLLSWETFVNPGEATHQSGYLSEAGNTAFDIATSILKSDARLPEEVSVIRNNVFLRSLFNLGLGRSSALFRYDGKRKTFARINTQHNISGLSQSSANSIIERLTHCGRLTRHLRDFVDRTYAASKAYPAKVALANTIATIINALEQRLTAISRDIQSVLQLQDVFERPHRMLTEVYDLARAVRNARTNEELSSLVYKRCQHCDQEPEWIRSMMLQILARVSQPWLELAEQWIGFKDDIGMHLEWEDTNFVDCVMPSEAPKNEDVDGPREVQYTYRVDKLPLFMTAEDGQTLFTLGRDLRILRTHHSDHPLARTTVARTQDVSFQWQNSWEDADRIATKAREFEAALSSAVRDHQRGECVIPAKETPNQSHSASTEVDTFDPFALPSAETVSSMPALPDELFDIIAANLSTESTDTGETLMDFSPPTAILPVLSFNPLLLAQQRILNAVMMRFFFSEVRSTTPSQSTTQLSPLRRWRFRLKAYSCPVRS